MVDTIRMQYKQMKTQEKVMEKCIEQLNKLEGQHDEYYNRTIQDSMAQYRILEGLIDTWCDSFGISKKEIDPSIAV
ncbi:hypothetical protein D3C72_2165470 [compost metagenome]